MKSLQSQHVLPFPTTLDTQKSDQISGNQPLSNFKETPPSYSTNATSCGVHCNAWYAPFSLPYLKCTLWWALNIYGLKSELFLSIVTFPNG